MNWKKTSNIKVEPNAIAKPLLLFGILTSAFLIQSCGQKGPLFDPNSDKNRTAASIQESSETEKKIGSKSE